MAEFLYNGRRIHYSDSRVEFPIEKPVIFFIHGLASSSRVFARQIEYFRTTYRCISLDLFGHGKSDSPSPESVGEDFYSLSNYSDSIIALLSHLSVEKATLLGWSLGSAIAFNIALSFPHIIENLILVAHTPVFFSAADHNFPAFTPTEAKIIIDSFKKEGDTFFETFVAQQYPEAQGIDHPDYVEEAISDASALKPDVAHTVFKVNGYTDFRPVVHQIRARTLLVSGAEDKLCQLSAAKWMHESLEKSTLVSYAGCGHVPFVGPSAERFSRDVAKFLAHGISQYLCALMYKMRKTPIERRRTTAGDIHNSIRICIYTR